MSLIDSIKRHEGYAGHPTVTKDRKIGSSEYGTYEGLGHTSKINNKKKIENIYKNLGLTPEQAGEYYGKELVVGYGHMLKDKALKDFILDTPNYNGTETSARDYYNNLTEEQATDLLEKDIELYKSYLNDVLNKSGIDRDSLSESQYDTLTEMTFQMGAGNKDDASGVMGFQKMLKAIQDRDWDEAAKQIKDSDLYNQTQGRSENYIRGILKEVPRDEVSPSLQNQYRELGRLAGDIPDGYFSDSNSTENEKQEVVKEDLKAYGQDLLNPEVDLEDPFADYEDVEEESESEEDPFAEYEDVEEEPEEEEGLSGFLNDLFGSKVKPSMDKIEGQDEQVPVNPLVESFLPDVGNVDPEIEKESLKDIIATGAGVSDAVTFGHADEAAGLISEDAKESIRAAQKKLSEENPAAFLAGNIIGGIAMGNPIGAGASKIAPILGLAKAAKAKGKIAGGLKTAGIGVGEGQLYGMGTSEKDIMEDTAGVIKDGLDEALLGGGLGFGIGTAVSKSLPKKAKDKVKSKLLQDEQVDALDIVDEEDMNDLLTLAEKRATKDFDKNQEILASMEKTLEDGSLVKLLKGKANPEKKAALFKQKVDTSKFADLKVGGDEEIRKLVKNLDEDSRAYTAWRNEVLGYVRWLQNSSKGAQNLKTVYKNMTKEQAPLGKDLEDILDKLKRSGKMNANSYSQYKMQQNLADSFYTQQQKKLADSLSGVESKAAKDEITKQIEEEIIHKDPLGFLGKKWLNANTVAEVVDSKAGTDIQNIISKAHQARNLKTSWEAPIKSKIGKATDIKMKDGISDAELIEIIESGKSHPVANEYRKIFKEIREEANKLGVKIEEYKLGQDKYVKMKKKTGVPLIKAFKNKFDELKEVGDDPELLEAVKIKEYTNDLKQFLAENSKDLKKTKEGKNALAVYKQNLADASKKLKSLGKDDIIVEEVVDFKHFLSRHMNTKLDTWNEVKKAMNKIDSPDSISNSIDPQISALFSRGDRKLPMWVRETNIERLMQQNLEEVGRSVFYQPVADLMDSRTPYLASLGMKDMAKYFNTWRNDIMGIRRPSAEDTMKVLKTRLELKLDESDLGKFVLGLWNFSKSALYPNFLGNSPAKIIRNLSQPLTMTLPELGYDYALDMSRHMKDTLNDLATNKAKFNADREALAEYGILTKRDLKPEDFEGIKAGFKEYFEGSPVARKADKFIDGWNDTVMKGYSMSDTINRMATAKMANQLVDDLFEGSEKAMNAIKKTPMGVQKNMQKAIDAGLGKNAIKEILMKHYDMTTQLSYGKMDMNEVGRDLGPLFTMLTKWPVSVTGDIYKKLKIDGMKGLSDSTKKYVYPLIAAMMIDSIVDENNSAHRALVGGSGFAGWLPVQSAIGNEVSDFVPIPTILGAMRFGTGAMDFATGMARGGEHAEYAADQAGKELRRTGQQYLPVIGSAWKTIDEFEKIRDAGKK